MESSNKNAKPVLLIDSNPYANHLGPRIAFFLDHIPHEFYKSFSEFKQNNFDYSNYLGIVASLYLDECKEFIKTIDENSPPTIMKVFSKNPTMEKMFDEPDSELNQMIQQHKNVLSLEKMSAYELYRALGITLDKAKK